MAQSVASGAFGYVNYGFESTKGTVASSFPRPFGQGVKITVNRKNNMERVFGVGARNASANVAKKYEGSATVEFLLGAGETTLAHGGASWLRAVLGATPTDGGATPYTHSYAESNTIVSFSIAHGIELGTNDYVSALIGCEVQSCTVSFAIDEAVKVRLECPYRTETLATTGIGSAVVPTEVPLTFVQGTLSVNGQTVGYLQSGELTITNNVEFTWGAGSRYATATTPKTRTYDMKFNAKLSDTTLFLTNFFGTTTPIAAADLATLNPAGVACVLTFDNGLATSNSRKVVFTFANLYGNEDSITTDVNEVVPEDFSGWALSCTSIVVSNGQSTDVASP